MNRVPRLVNTLFLAALVVASSLSATCAQSPCAHAEFRLDTDFSVDTAAICRAAESWADEGMRIFVYLTDVRPQNEKQWYELLDQVEAEAGLRDPNLPDSFERSAVAFESSTAPEPSWASTITYGELLYGSPLDADDSVALALKKTMRSGIEHADPTSGIVEALNAGYQAIFVNPISPQSDSSSPAPPAEQSSRALPWTLALLATIGLGAAGVVGYAVYVRVIRPYRERARHIKALRQHLDELENRTANLLNACDQLLSGDEVDQTILYQLFAAYGGEGYDALQGEVREWLRRSQSALSSAFALRKQLLDPTVLRKQTLEQTILAWETLYVTIVGSSQRILSLTEAELQVLLDPLLSRKHSTPSAQLEQQLKDVQRDVVGGWPLKVELILVDASEADAEGILGYIDRAKTEIARLSDAQHQAPEDLAQARRRRKLAEEAVPDDFPIRNDQLFRTIDEILKEGKAALERGAALDAITLVSEAAQGIEAVTRLVDAVVAHESRDGEITAILDLGYRPEGVPEDLAQVQSDLEAAVREISSGEFSDAMTWIDELEADSQRALSASNAWVLLRDQNEGNARDLANVIARTTEYGSSRTYPDWEKLRAYPDGNWVDVADDLDSAENTLGRLSGELLVSIQNHNSMEQQRFADAERLLAQATSDLAFVQRSFEGVVNRLAEVQTAENHIREALQLTQTKIDDAIALRDQDDAKIGAQVDLDLEQAQAELAHAQRLAGKREFIAASLSQTTSHELAEQALASTSRQVSEINALQEKLRSMAERAQDDVDDCVALAGALPDVAQTKKTNDLVRKVNSSISKAHQVRARSTDLEDRALAAALQTAIAAYDEVTQLAQTAEENITADRESYDQSLTATRSAVFSAEKAIQKARWAVKEPDARNAGWHALQRAENALAQIGSLESSTSEALLRARHNAQQAEADALRAESQAQQALDRVQAERRRRLARVGGSVAPRIVLGSKTRSAGRSSSRQKSPWRSTSSRGTSRRTVSRSSSKRK